MEEGEEFEGSGAGDRAVGIAGGGGRGFFMEPVSPGIAMSLGRKIMSGKPSIIFKSHLHGLKRFHKKPPPAVPCNPRRPVPCPRTLRPAARYCLAAF